MRHIIKTTTYLILVLSSLSSSAQVEMSLEQCRKMALQKNEDIKIADATIEKAQAEKKAMMTYYLPSVSASGTGVYMKDDFETELYMPTATPNLTTGELDPNIMTDATGTPVVDADGNYIFNMYAYMPLELSLKGAYMAGVNIEQAIYTGGKIASGNKIAAISVDMAEENRALKQMEAVCEADQAYWLYVSIREKVKLAETAIEMLTELQNKVNDAYSTGMVQQNDLLKVQVEYNKALLSKQKARNGMELTRMSLCRVTGLDFSTPVNPVDSLVEFNTDSLFIDTAVSISDRPEFKLLEKQIALEAENVKLARADYLPTVGVSAGYSYLGGIELSDQEITSSNVTVMASVKIPIFSWGQGVQKTKSAKATKLVKELEFQKNEELLRLQVEQAKRNLEDAEFRISISETAIRQAEENLRVSKDNYELGACSMTDLLTAQMEWQKAYSELIDAKTDYKLKETEYLKVTAHLI